MKTGSYILKCIIATFLILIGAIVLIVSLTAEAREIGLTIVAVILIILGGIVIRRAINTHKYGKRVNGSGVGYAFKSSEEKAQIQQAKKDRIEAGTSLSGITVQPIGQIPARTQVKLNLDPQSQSLIISNKENKISLAYSKIISFVLDSESNIEAGGSTIGRAVLGGMLAGGLGSIVGGMSAKNKVSYKWIGQLTYQSNGESKELIFVTLGDKKQKSIDQFQFEQAVNRIAAAHAEKITEL